MVNSTLELPGSGAVELDGAGEVLEAAAHLAHQVADLERGLGVGLVDGVGRGRPAGRRAGQAAMAAAAAVEWRMGWSPRVGCWLGVHSLVNG